ncbi:hypothetical protein [Marinithermofilum abyssi]|nr:hypothetical protein [Marinithermofilum abyssi]
MFLEDDEEVYPEMFDRYLQSRIHDGHDRVNIRVVTCMNSFV